MSGKQLSQDFMDLTLFFLTAARGCVDEPHIYGPLRLVDGASKVLALGQKIEGERFDKFLSEVKEMIDREKYVVMESEEKFVALIDRLIALCVDEMKARRGRR